jgi:hypothetical protein
MRDIAQNIAVQQLSQSSASSSGMWFGIQPNGTIKPATFGEMTVSQNKIIIDIIYGILLIVCGIAMFKWKKWGAYGYFIVEFLVFIIYSVLSPGAYLTMFNISDSVVTLGIVFWIISRKWKMFE